MITRNNFFRTSDDAIIYFEDYSKDMIVATFLSILDMCKNKEITLSQRSNFGDIIIEKVTNE